MKNFRRNIGFLRGSTLIEVVVSMSILLSILTLFFTQTGKISGTMNPHAIYQAFLITDSIFLSDNILDEQNDEEARDGFKVYKTVDTEAQELYFVEVVVRDRMDREVFRRTKWISKNIEP